MKDYIKTSLLVIITILGLCACSNDVLKTYNNNSPEGIHRVSVTFGTGANTRAAEIPAIDREKAIDPDQVFAVLFSLNNDGGIAYKMTRGTDNPSANPIVYYYDFNVPEAGAYYMYVVANSTTITDGESFSSPADLYAKIETADPKDDGTSTNFLMVSDKQLLDVVGNADTEISVNVTRAVARIDVETFTGFTVKSITITNRYLSSVIGRTTTGLLTMEASLNKETTHTYTINPASQNVNELIYTYENLDSDPDNQVKITVIGDHNGEEKKVSASFTSGIQRNKIYKLVVSETGAGATMDMLDASILVVDWDGTTILDYKELKDQDKPDFYIPTTNSYYKLTGGTIVDTETQNPTSMWVQYKANASVSIRIVGSKVGSAIVSSDIGAPEAVESTPGHTDNGNIEQNFTLTFPTSTPAGSTFTYKIYNRLNETDQYSFDVVVGFEKKKNPLWWIAEYNLKLATDNVTYSFDHTEDINQGSTFRYNVTADVTAHNNHSIMDTKWVAQNTTYNGWQIPTSPDETRTLEGEVWHVPTVQEIQSIFPMNHTAGELLLSSGSGVFGSNAVVTEPTTVFGYNATTKTPTAHKSYWSSYDATNHVRYAIRYLDEDYCSVWKYQCISDGDQSRLEVTSKLVEMVSSSDPDIAAKLSEIMSGSYNWTTLSEENGEIKRVFYMTGYPGSVFGYTPNDAGVNNVQRQMCNWLMTTTSWPNQTNTNGSIVGIYTNLASQQARAYSIHWESLGTNNSISVRLFRDK